MMLALISIFSLYVLIKLYVSVMQIGTINHEKRKTPVLLAPSDFTKAAES